MENKTIYIDEGELIVGERGETPMATPTYPELINERGKVFLNKELKVICQQIVLVKFQKCTI
ncbi:MAG: pyruvate formate lyase family protein [Atribacterota bacterium]|nr:pyruvate formate lyase family protein [Atribacterota bacterium]